MSKMNNRQLNSVISICSSTLKMKYIPSWAQKICSSNSSSHDLNSRDCIPCLMFSNVEHPSPPPPSILAQFEARNVQNNNIVFFCEKGFFLCFFFCDDPKSFHHSPVVNRTEARFGNIRFSVRFGSARFGSFRFFQENRTEYLQDKIKYKRVSRSFNRNIFLKKIQ